MVIAEFVPLAVVILVPFSVHAGVLTTLLDMVGNDTETAVPAPVEPEDSASGVKLLTARTTPDQRAALGGAEILVADGALSSQGPFGSDEFTGAERGNGEISVYVVREGDSLSEVAEMFGVTTNTIMWANDLPKATAIKPGDTLVILPIVGVRHIVKSGDTVASIAKKYEGNAEEILAYNELSSGSDLTVGDTIIVPGGNMHEAAPKKAVASKSGGTTGGSSGAKASGAGLIHPLPGAVRTQGIHGYNAVDLAAPIGTPIRAAGAGEVIVSKGSGWNGGYGNYVVVKHANGSQTLYAHLSSNAVGIGDTVGAGETVGYVGTSGKSTGAHLHFEVRGAKNPF